MPGHNHSGHGLTASRPGPDQQREASSGISSNQHGRQGRRWRGWLVRAASPCRAELLVPGQIGGKDPHTAGPGSSALS